MKLTFYGGAKMVTGSNYLLDTGKTRVLIDCGLFQGSHYADDLNFEPFPYDLKTIDAVLVTHAHIDHTGRLPKLYRDGYRGKIYSTAPTKDFSEQLLLDSEHILLKEAENRKLPPLYDIDDVNEVMKLWEKRSYHEKFRVNEIEVEFFDAGHILGSAFILVKAEGKTIVFSGDLGNVPAPLVKDTEIIKMADYVLIESAYGNRIHEDLLKSKGIFEDTIEDTIKSNGVLMIPAFAMERTQELLYELNELVEYGRIPSAPVFIDSPLAIKITAIYQKYSRDKNYFDTEALAKLKKGDAIFDFPRLKLTLTSEQSKEINDIPAPKIIIAGSGMSQGGRILHHEMRYLSDPNSTILFVGYQSKGSLGRFILDGAKNVKIFGVDISVKCKIMSISGYSAHADQKMLLNWLAPMKHSIKKIFIVQGEDNQMLPFSEKARDELAIETEIPEYNQTINL
ncbi:MAG: MBL fold metallo-hydrolase [Patescibacteria group bacterium]|nr:MBL fold metallo-hydrolase [Patescibacteria group bacterium]